MVKRASTFGLCKVFAVALVVCLIGWALAHSSLAQAAIPDELRSAPVVRLSPASLDFGIQALGARSPQRTITLTNAQQPKAGPADFHGDAPFSGATFSTPNEAYFAHADHVISCAAAYGITVFLFPAYLGNGSGQCNIHNEGWGTDMERASDAVMRAWGVYVGNRYKVFPNIIYVLGCDADPRTCSPPLVGKLNAVAAGIKSVDSGHLMTADNAGDQSSLDVWSGCGCQKPHLP